jgi:hypothetical protein
MELITAYHSHLGWDWFNLFLPGWDWFSYLLINLIRDGIDSRCTLIIPVDDIHCLKCYLVNTRYITLLSCALSLSTLGYWHTNRFFCKWWHPHQNRIFLLLCSMEIGISSYSLILAATSDHEHKTKNKQKLTYWDSFRWDLFSSINLIRDGIDSCYTLFFCSSIS